MPESPVLFLVGPTAAGKSSVGIEVAASLSAEIVSLDSMALYRGMDIATAKPSPADRSRVRHHLIDILDPHEHSSVGDYVVHARRAIEEICSRGKLPLFVGGTPLYLKAMTVGLFDGPAADWELRLRLEEVAEREGSAELHRRLVGLDPRAAARIHPNDVRRLVRALEVQEKKGKPISSLQTQFGSPRKSLGAVIVGLRRERDDWRRRIDARVEEMFNIGLIEETRTLLSLEKPMGRAARQAVGYAEVILYLQGRISLAEAKKRIKARTRKFVRKQMTWFRHFDELTWIDAAAAETAEDVAPRMTDAFRRRLAQ